MLAPIRKKLVQLLWDGDCAGTKEDEIRLATLSIAEAFRRGPHSFVGPVPSSS